MATFTLKVNKRVVWEEEQQRVNTTLSAQYQSHFRPPELSANDVSPNKVLPVVDASIVEFDRDGFPTKLLGVTDESGVTDIRFDRQGPCRIRISARGYTPEDIVLTTADFEKQNNCVSVVLREMDMMAYSGGHDLGIITSALWRKADDSEGAAFEFSAYGYVRFAHHLKDLLQQEFKPCYLNPTQEATNQSHLYVRRHAAFDPQDIFLCHGLSIRFPQVHVMEVINLFSDNQVAEKYVYLGHKTGDEHAGEQVLAVLR
ncbi:hypothetical protein [Vibrio nitrifigilis]|uniref:Carboxypeptidase regulatory-like domain-containing protein n=1 Tax=Vibrio nitrifigilis TaxID=2789781 RepID=A0ABS0GCT3_9VIBR|nr:hypothetical protein [Vibrio nitrifigilis]MBF9000217.1 hypothetical protein [Vibrio nitrifigilis]